MILSMETLGRTYPKQTRNVLYKIYQNQGESSHARVAAVFLLLKTQPPFDMLQKMASYTNIDANEKVNAAVKSALSAASQLEGPKYAQFRSDAKSAMNHLSPKTYGYQYPHRHLFGQTSAAKQLIDFFGSDDSAFPNGVSYAYKQSGDERRPYMMALNAFVSSVDDLYNVFGDSVRGQRQRRQSGTPQEGSAEHWRRFLGVENEDSEQLEGYAELQMGGLNFFFSFSNKSVEMLPEAIQKLQETMKKNPQYRYTKMFNQDELAISFPTETALPFIYTYDAPTLLNFKGKLETSFQPEIASGGKFNQPEKYQAQSEHQSVVSWKVQGQLGFITPFDHKQYGSGFDKNIQFNIPFKKNIQFDFQKRQFQAEIEYIKPEQEQRLFDYSTAPYITQYDIMNFTPTINRPGSKIIRSDSPNGYQAYVGGKSTGMVYDLSYVTDEQYYDYRWLYEHAKEGVFEMLPGYGGRHMTYNKMHVDYQGDMSSSRKMHISASYVQKYVKGNNNNNNNNKNNQGKSGEENQEENDDLLQTAAEGMNGADVFYAQAKVSFQGSNQVDYHIAGASAKSSGQSRTLFLLKRQSSNAEIKPYKIGFSSRSRSPMVDETNVKNALEQDLTSSSEVRLTYGYNTESTTRLTANIKYGKSGRRQRYLQQHPMFERCLEEMESGNYQMPACEYMTTEAGYLDRVQMNIKHENVQPEMYGYAKLLGILDYMNYLNYEEKNSQGGTPEGTAQLEVRYSPDFSIANVSLAAPNYEINYKKVRLADWTKPFLAVHPGYDVPARIYRQMTQYESHQASCVVDTNAVNTFDNKTYPADLDDSWYVVYMYEPREARRDPQRQHRHEKHAVFVRQNGENKEGYLQVQRNDNQKQLRVDMKPGNGDLPRITVDQQEVQYGDEYYTQTPDGQVKIYRLLRGVKLEVEGAYQLIYDGKRMKMYINDAYRGDARGLCGDFNGEAYDDLRTPQDCIAEDQKDFIESYRIKDQPAGKPQKCYYKHHRAGNVISGDARKKYSGMKQRTRYVQEGEQVCFSSKPIYVCKEGYMGGRSTKKSVEVHCVAKSNVSKMWMEQIDKGANPSFAHKPVTKKVYFDIPQYCEQQ